MLALVLAAALALLPQPERAEAIDVPGPCDVPGVSVVCDAADGAASAAAGAAGDAILGQLTGWVGDGAAWLLRQVADAIDSTTAVDLSAPWFQSHYAFMFQVGAILLLPLVLLTVLQALLRQDAMLLVRLALLYLPAAMLFTGLAVAVSQTAIGVVDALSAELTVEVAKDTDRLATSLTQVSALGGPVPLFASFLMALVMALAALFVWFELILRAGVVYVAMMFLPLFLATMIWPATSGWVRRLVQLIVAAILSKLVIVATLSLGLSALSSGDGVSSVLAGAGMFMIAAFSPFVLFSLIPLAAEVAQPQREGRHALAAATGTSLAWNVARTRMAFGTVGAGAAPMALGSGAMGMAGPRGGGGPIGPAGGPPSPAGPGSPGGPAGGGSGAAAAASPVVRSAAPAPAPSTPPAAPAASQERPPTAAPRPIPTRSQPPARPYLGGGDGI
ncbi:MAG: hypothetical protein AB7V58_03845 [Solirubrobacterales bacterium]